MPHGHFVWTDLSTYDMATARADYAKLFAWSFAQDAAYDFASLNGAQVAAVFPMPEPLAARDMPSFWMSYVQVEGLDACVDRARRHDGVVVEVEPQAFGDDARISLVRDPSGAGFTLYEGPEIAAPGQGPGFVVARYHHVNDIGTIEPFYRDLFGWAFVHLSDTPWPVYALQHADGTVVARAEQVPERIRGTFRYWMPGFQVDSMADSLAMLAQCGGGSAAQLDDNRCLVSDRQGAHFILQTG